MAFSDDGGGFAFACDDAKFLICAGTWNTHLSQIGRMEGAIHIMTNLLPNPEYIAKIISKRPRNIFIIANSDARDNAEIVKRQFPDVRIALHPKMNAKIVFIAPKTVWVSSSDFGETKMVESAVGLHSANVHNRGIEELFNIEWGKSVEL